MVRATFALLSLLLLTGCDDNSRADSRTLDVEDPDFRQGQMFYKQGEIRKALEAYLKVIDNRKGAAESNLEAGRMYLELQDPLPAIYHFNQYVRLKPNSQQTPMVKQMIKTAEKQFMQQLPGRPMEPDATGSTDINTRLRGLQFENDKLKREIADLNRGQRTPEVKPTNPLIAAPNKDPKANDLAPAGRFRPHIIVRGDTLSIISRKYYGDTNHISAIFAANRDKMTSINTLPKLGTVLLIPE